MPFNNIRRRTRYHEEEEKKKKLKIFFSPLPPLWYLILIQPPRHPPPPKKDRVGLTPIYIGLFRDSKRPIHPRQKIGDGSFIFEPEKNQKAYRQPEIEHMVFNMPSVSLRNALYWISFFNVNLYPIKYRSCLTGHWRADHDS